LISKRDNLFEVKADLPGMKKGDIVLAAHQDVHSISATREDKHK